MARPLSVTDAEIMDATERVASRSGMQGLTVSEVAREVGLSRAAITLRFAGTDALRRLLMERLARQFEEEIAAVSLEFGPNGLLTVAAMLGSRLKGREQFANFWLRYYANILDPVALELEERRGRALRELIGSIMPETAIEKSAAVDAFMAHMTGSMLNWHVSDHPDAAVFLRARAVDWIRLAGIPLGDERS